MNQEHITERDWIALFSARDKDADWMRLQSRIMDHVNGCEPCRELYEKGMALGQAARAVANASAPRMGSGAAFRAVASAGAPRPGASKTRGRLCVCLDTASGAPAFIEDTLELEGCANKYALNPDEDGRCLADDDDALRLTLRGDRLAVYVANGEPGGECLLIAEGEDDRRAALSPGGEAELELPPDSFCTLEITFGGNR